MTGLQPTKPIAVVKVGGSLFDLPDLSQRISTLLETLPGMACILVPGGGARVDAIRAWDRTYQLGEERAHWLALTVLALNAHVLARIVPHGQVVPSIAAAFACLGQDHVPIMDLHRFASDDEACVDHLPHTWAVTSDALAARVAITARAQRLILLKSIAVPEAPDWHRASQNGKVDPVFPELVANAEFEVHAIDVRNMPLVEKRN